MVYVSNVYFPQGGSTLDDLLRRFRNYGKIRSIQRLNLGPITGPNIYFIEFQNNDEESQDAMNLNGVLFNQQPLQVSSDKPSPKEYSRSNLPTYPQQFQLDPDMIYEEQDEEQDDDYLSFEDLKELMQSGNIRRWEVFGQGHRGNNVLSFYDNIGQVYYVLARYNPDTNTIHPPI